MPYIVPDKRKELDPIIEDLRKVLVSLALDDESNNHSGNLNYIITKLLMISYGTVKDTNYASINEAIGVLECAKLEFYRKVAAPYEDTKEEINGPVSTTTKLIKTTPITNKPPGENILADTEGMETTDGC